MSFLFPDINVWVAMAHDAHAHHQIASDWFESLDSDADFRFSRFTQLGFLRLLTAEAVMGEHVLSQSEAWAVYDRWLRDDRVELAEEPAGLEQRFRALTRSRQASPKAWGDAYLAAFAEVSQMTLVTFDHALRGKTPHVLLLEK